MMLDWNNKHKEEDFDVLIGAHITAIIEMYKYADMDFSEFIDYLYHRFQKEDIDTEIW